MAKDFDIEKFNSDPAFESERTQFDQMFESAFARFVAKEKAKNPEPDPDLNIFDILFGDKNKGGENGK
jgi:hypothetical protein